MFSFVAVVLASPIEVSMDDCVIYIQEDELVDLLSIRMCKNPKSLLKKH